MVSTKATSKVITMRRKKLKSTLRQMGKIAFSQRGKSHVFIPSADHAPIILGRRALLRPQISVPVKLFVALHRLYKEDSMRATNVLASKMGDEDDEPTRRINVILRCAIQELWEE